MNSEAFTYWLQGFVELQESDSISDNQWSMIKDHLKLVFTKVTPVYSPSVTKLNDLIGKEWPSTIHTPFPLQTATC